MPMNMLEAKKLGQFLVKNAGKPMDSTAEKEEDVNEEAASLEMMKEFISAVSDNKPEKALRAFKMLAEIVYEECEEEDDKYNGMKFAENETY